MKQPRILLILFAIINHTFNMYDTQYLIFYYLTSINLWMKLYFSSIRYDELRRWRFIDEQNFHDDYQDLYSRP